jgi:Arm DNA-binding domain
MGAKRRELGPLAVSHISREGIHFVGGVAGLGLNATQSGSRSWVLRYQIGGVRRDLGLGDYPDVTLPDSLTWNNMQDRVIVFGWLLWGTLMGDRFWAGFAGDPPRSSDSNALRCCRSGEHMNCALRMAASQTLLFAATVCFKVSSITG